MPDAYGYKYTHSFCVILIVCHCNNGCTNALCVALHRPSCSDVTITETAQKYFVKTLCNKRHKNSFSEVRRKDTSILLIALKIRQSA